MKADIGVIGLAVMGENLILNMESKGFTVACYNRTVSKVNRFIEGDTELNSVDNLAFQPHTGILYVIEDHSNGDVFACLPDGPDREVDGPRVIRRARRLSRAFSARWTRTSTKADSSSVGSRRS